MQIRLQEDEKERMAESVLLKEKEAVIDNMQSEMEFLKNQLTEINTLLTTTLEDNIELKVKLHKTRAEKVQLARQHTL